MFKFELNSVLSLKEKVEDTKKRELGAASTHKEGLEQQKEILVTEHDGLYNAIKANTCADFDIKQIRTLNRYSHHIKKRIKQAENDINKAQEVVEQKRDELLQAMKERKILEKLKEIKLEHYVIEAKRTEQLLIDEMVSYKYGEARRSEA
ncbi:flagellar export protein FliJ [Cellulosilyticum sp. I15G10I2]|uniref:flagellar export protein FliJ n=1 Tax=Cellulosilyticum sp. I15G10I2 TaxID=1892843 RepID=UPI00085BE74B|nr:flagellar export protein FliJ [Cellulosilyticum sp. I15G10I2]